MKVLLRRLGNFVPLSNWPLMLFILVCLTVCEVDLFPASSLPTEEQCSAVFVGRVESLNLVRVRAQNLGKRGRFTAVVFDEFWKAEVRIESVSKQESQLGDTTTIYYEQRYGGPLPDAEDLLVGRGRGCPDYPKISKGQRARFYCVTSEENAEQVLFVPEGGWVVDVGIKRILLRSKATEDSKGARRNFATTNRHQ